MQIYREELLGITPVAEEEWRKQDLAEGKVELQCSHNRCLSQSSGELWGWADPSELSQLRWGGGQAFVFLHLSVISLRGRHNFAKGKSLLKRVVSSEGQHCEPSAEDSPRSWGTDATWRRGVKIWAEHTVCLLDCSDSLAFYFFLL